MSERCQFCDELIEDTAKAYLAVVAWERPGRGVGGQSGSSLVLRERTGQLAHDTCIARELHGINVGQEALGV